MRPSHLLRKIGHTAAVLTAAATVAVAVGVPAGHAQAVERRPVRVAIPTQFPASDARALVVRYASPEKGDLIVLNPADLTPDALVAAVALLRHLRKAELPADQTLVATVKGFAPLGRGDPRLLQRLTTLLARLRAQPPARIGNLGQGQWIDVPESILSS